MKTATATTYAFAIHRAISSSPGGQPTPGPLLSRHRSLELAMRKVQLLRVPVLILDANGEIVEQVRALDHTERLILKQREALRNLPLAFFKRHGLTIKDLNHAYFRFPTKSKWREFQSVSGYTCYGMDNGRNVFALLPYSPFSTELVNLAIRFGATIVDLERQQDLLRLFYFVEGNVS